MKKAHGAVTCCGLALLLTLAGCGRDTPPPPGNVHVNPALGRDAPGASVPKVRFTDVTAKAGIRFHHVNGAFGRKLLPETMGSGVAFVDLDGDGRPDLLFVNSCHWPGHEDRSRPAPTLKLYRNVDGVSFADVTEEAGLAVTLYGMGVTVGDYDNDGRPDLFVTAVGGNRLFRNVSGKGGLRFEDVTARAGDLASDTWPKTDNFLSHKAEVSFPSSAAFLDYDGDGLLDLFVCNYVTWSPHLDLRQKFTLKGAGRAYGPPRAFAGAQCALYRNLGDGKFQDVSARAGIHVTGELGAPVGKALGVTVCDADGDGRPDIVVANDTVRNFFFHNLGGGQFRETGQETGLAYADGSPRGAMGIDWGEYRPGTLGKGGELLAGRFAIVIGNFANEPNTLFSRDTRAPLKFSDWALTEGLAGPSRIVLKFGLFWFDFDLDGFLDLLTCNGHLEPDIHLVEADQRYRQPAQLFWNTGGKRAFEPVTAAHVGADLFKPIVGRGCAYADMDGDGNLDVVLTENGGPAVLLRNEGGTGNRWVRLLLEGDGKRSNTSAIGAVVKLTAGGKVYQREVTSARGYLSQSEFALTFGLGRAEKVDRVEIAWPGRDGGTQVLTDLEVNRLHHIRQAPK